MGDWGGVGRRCWWRVGRRCRGGGWIVGYFVVFGEGVFVDDEVVDLGVDLGLELVNGGGGISG